MKTLRFLTITLSVTAALLLFPLRAMEPAFREPPLPKIPQRPFRITSFAAKVDELTTITKAIQTAINTAKSGGGGIVVVPSGNFLSGPVQLASHVNLRLEAGATLTMLPLDQYPGGSTSPEDFISGRELQDIAITGPGAIEGQGS